MSGAGKFFYNFVYAKNQKAFKINSKKDHTALGKLENGEWKVFGNYKYGSGMLSPLFNSNSLVIINQGKDMMDEGIILKVIPFNTDFCERNDFFNDLS